MNCIWILLLLCSCSNGNCNCENRCGEREGSRERCQRRCERRCENVLQDVCEDVCEDICDRSSIGRQERIIPGVRSDYTGFDNNVNYDRRERRNDGRNTGRSDTCGCEA